MRPMWEMLRPFFAFVWLFVITVVWSFFSRNDVINKEPRILWILYGTIFSNIAVSTEVIIAMGFKSNESFKLRSVVPTDSGPNVGHALRCLQCAHVATGRHSRSLLFSLLPAGLRLRSDIGHRTMDTLWSNHFLNFSSLALRLRRGKISYH